MAPKKKGEVQKLSLNEFLVDQSYGSSSWADEVEEVVGTQPPPVPERRSGYGPSAGGYNSGFGMGDRGYSTRDSFPQRIPDKPPYTAHLGNLSYEATEGSISDFFAHCEITNVRIVEDREQMRPKGFGYAEFATPEGLQKALNLDGDSLDGRVIRVKIADPPRGGDREARDLDWGATRQGPLPDTTPARRGPPDFERRGPPRDLPADDGKVRDFSNWERRGPPAPVAQPADGGREGGRSRFNDRPDSFRERRASPAWGPSADNQDGSRPPRREFVPERAPAPERAPTAADRDMRWRESMRPDQAKSPGQSQSGSEAPTSPQPSAAAVAPGGRPKLNLAKRTVPESEDAQPDAAAAGDAKASPFGAARPINTAQREREIEEKRQAAIKEKKEADEKAKEEKRLAKEAAAAKEAEDKAAAEKEAEEKAAAEAAKAAEAAEAPAAEAPAADKTEDQKTPAEETTAQTEAKAEDTPAQQTTEATAEAETPRDQKLPARTREPREPRGDAAVARGGRAAEAGNWRSSGDRRGGVAGGPRGGGRGGGRGRGSYDNVRSPRANGSPQQAQATPAQGQEGPASPGPVVDEDGWTMVPNKGRRGQGRPLVS